MVPLILTLTPEFGLAEFWVTWTPAALPCNSWSTVADCLETSSSTTTELTAPVRSLFKTVPYPTTTTSSKASVSGCKLMLIES